MATSSSISAAIWARRPSFSASATGSTHFAAAISFALVAIGEACRQLVGGDDAAGGPPPAPLVAAHPEIDWRGWIGLRNVLTHGYHRRDPPVIWRAMGELRALVQACKSRTISEDESGA